MSRFSVPVLIGVQLTIIYLIGNGQELNYNSDTTEGSEPATYEQTVCPFKDVEEIEYTSYFAKLCTPHRCFCAGAIVGIHWVVTAGHCVYKNAHPMNVYTGNASLNQSKKYSVVHTVIHPSFGVRHGVLKIRNNIALLFVEPAFKFEWSPEMFPLSIHPPIEGVTYPVYTIGKEMFRVYNITILTYRECKRDDKVPGHTYCSNGCHMATDSETGGPMVDGEKLLGIASFGESPTRRTFTPGVVYVKICDYVQWINEVVANAPQIRATAIVPEFKD